MKFLFHFSHLIRSISLLVCLYVGIGCSSVSKIVKERPVLTALASSAGVGSSEEKTLRGALSRQSRKPMVALSDYMAVAQASSKRLASDPEDSDAQKIYNFAVGRIVDTVEKSGLDPWSKPIEVAGERGVFKLTHKHDKRKAWDPKRFILEPADQYKVGGSYFSKRSIREGIGAPVVAVAREVDLDANAKFAPSRVYYGVTAIARFKGDVCEIAFEDPLAAETTLLGARRFPLAADFSVPLAAMLEDDANNPEKLGLARLFNPGEHDGSERIVRLEPYDPDKTVVLVIHGLASSQAAWTPLINTLRGDAEIRRDYQFWFYSYPTGYPYPYPAMMLRRELDRVKTVFPLRKPMVVVGHSMGGCISRLLITDTGDDVWRGIFKRSPEETLLSKSSKELLTEGLIFEHREEVGRVIFMSAPLKGSEMATDFIGRLGSRLVRMPKRLQKLGSAALSLGTFKPGELQVKRFPDSIDTLAPNNRFVQVINTVPVVPGIPHHVVAGDRGRGDAPNSSDGIVPYWSSHMDTAVSERIVPSGHSTELHPMGIAEVMRILKLHAQKR